MTYKGFNPVAFARSATTTLADHVRELEVSCLRNFQLGALLEANGRVTYGHGGEGFDWPVMYRLHNVEGNTGETQRNFARRNLYKVANLEYRGYQVTDSMYYREFRSNRGEHGIVKVYDNFIDRLKQSMNQALGTEYYVNGEATGREQSWHGMESLYPVASTAQTVNISTGAARTANQADIVGYPSGSYAGLTCTLGNYGGENESGEVWPDGIADSEYDFWTPLIVIADSTASVLPSSTNTFAGQGDEAIRYGLINAQRNASIDGQITNVVLSRDWYISFLNLVDDKEEIPVTSENNLRALGFKTITFDGIELSWEAAVPSETGYGYNYNLIELKSMDDTLLRSEGPEYDIHSQSFNAVVSTLSNLKFKSPRNFLKLCNYDDLGKNDS